MDRIEISAYETYKDAVMDNKDILTCVVLRCWERFEKDIQMMISYICFV